MMMMIFSSGIITTNKTGQQEGRPERGPGQERGWRREQTMLLNPMSLFLVGKADMGLLSSLHVK